uniref:anti-phage dCTP deaminase n=2 Tax=Flavobacterium sp. TaxID=239 RepID=UPI004049E266
MSTAKQLRIENTNEVIDLKDHPNLKDHLKDTITDELIVGLCGPIGTDINYISKCLKEILEDSFGYTCVEIKLSDFIKKKYNTDQSDKTYDYYDELISNGNDLRKLHGNDILAKLAIHQITKVRQKASLTPDDLVKSKRFCYIVNSIKNHDEYKILKLVYQNIFYFIGVFSPLDIRRKNLKDKGISNPDIEKLFEIDSDQNFSHGQKVTKTFPSSDYFLRVENSHEQLIKIKIERFLDLIFGTNIITPNYHETAMYLASSSSANSACLSRQVGASITNKKGDVISVGWNDVPKFGGNLYNSSDDLSNDHRCINKKGGKCFNDEEKDFLTNIIVEELISSKIVESEKKVDLYNKLRDDSRIKDLIEFSRAVHAEMHAIINATQKSGSEIIGGRLYCTTYPCHNCARHIVASGITEVYYIEPYKKSLALKLHDDAITENENEKNRVKILMYDGVSPNRYIDLFKMSDSDSRKKNGNKLLKKKKDASPRKSISLDAIPYLEQKATAELKKRGNLDNIM